MSARPSTSASGAARSPQDIDLPGVHDAANIASCRGQKSYLRLSATRLVALLVAAIAGALGLITVVVDLSGVILLAAFIAAAISEVALILFQPERDWFSGRAIAESTKTLAWRFAVQGKPFGPMLTSAEAESLLRIRLKEILTEGKDRLDVGADLAVITDSMRRLRNSNLKARRASYLEFRIRDQRKFYSSNAKKNRVRATAWRYALLGGEVCAVVAAAVALGRGSPFDFAGVIAALVASGAAWLAIKQHSQITSAYRVAAVELALQESVLDSVDENAWPQAVADAEEAISREHTMWLASRGTKSLTEP
jgi:hypothetical protein